MLYQNLNKSGSLDHQKDPQKKKTIVYNKTSELYNYLLRLYAVIYQMLKEKKYAKYNPINLFVGAFDYCDLFKKEKDTGLCNNERRWKKKFRWFTTFRRLWKSKKKQESKF